MIRRAAVLACWLAAAVGAAGCASTPRATDAAPRVAEFPRPEIPAGLTVEADVRARHAAAWDALQALDLRRAAAEFDAILLRSPGFYPARAGRGFTQLARRQYREADVTFAAVLGEHERYVPALFGRAEALVAAGRYGDALGVLERLVLVDPKRVSARTRLELVRLRVTQDSIDEARRSRNAGRLAEAEAHLERALSLAPASTAILRDLVSVEMLAGQLDEAEAHARRAVVLEPTDGQWHALVGDVLEARQSYREAAAAYSRAVALEPRPEWNARALDLREKAEAALLPASFARLTSATTVTRAETAAFIAIHLDAVVLAAPQRVSGIAVDIRTHWAASWIVPVTRAGIMTIDPNHTFRPNAPVTRAELARIASVLLRLAGSSRPAELVKWRAARPTFPDLPGRHASYADVAFATAAGAMQPDASGAFGPMRPATGPDLEGVVRRIGALGAGERARVESR
jgi:tetratricopeptide (TPR) repeat protein